jgi:hypothetical protein
MNNSNCNSNRQTYKDHVFDLLDQHGVAGITLEALVDQVGCTRQSARIYRRRWQHQHQKYSVEPASGQCRRCRMFIFDEPHNRLINGTCLWCWAHEVGMQLDRVAGALGWDFVLKKLTRAPKAQCHFCREPAITPAFIRPPLCLEHYEILLIVYRLHTRGRPVTLASVHEHLDTRAMRGMTIEHQEVPYLLEDIEHARYIVIESGAPQTMAYST